MHQLTIAGKAYRSRLLVGTGKYKDFAETRAAIDASGAEIVTVAIRRMNIGQDPGQPNLLDALPPAQRQQVGLLHRVELGHDRRERLRVLRPRGGRLASCGS